MHPQEARDTFLLKKLALLFGRYKKKMYLCTRIREITPAGATQDKRMHNGQLAQLVQSICLTSRGSAVRIRHCPHT